MMSMHTRAILLLALAVAHPAAHAQPVPAAQRVDPAIAARVDSLLGRMTLEEKVGEMTQLTSEAVSSTRGTATTRQALDSTKLDAAVVGHHVGSLLNVWDVALTPAEWRGFTGMVQRAAQRTRLKIPVIYGIDAVHGQHYMTTATVFPQDLAMAATWNPALVRRASQITAYETRAGGIQWNFAPVLDIGRQPLWSRFFETFGEDPYLASVLGAAYVEAQQHDPRAALDSLLGRAGRPVAPWPGPVFVAATGKHFLGYSLPRSGKDRTTAWIPERRLREYVLPPFRAAVDAGVRTVMINSGDINGEPVHASHRILTDLLRTELGFTGIAVSDWEDIIKLQTMHRVAPSYRDAARLAVMAGVDMSMVPQSVSFADTLLALVKDGTVPVARIDESVRRILTVKAELGLFTRAGPDSAMLADVGAPAFQAVSRAAAEEAVTLLKNEGGALPLADSARVLVVGPGATSLPAQFGSWSYTWQGTDTAVYPRGVRTLLDALRAHGDSARITYVPGAGFDTEMDLSAAVQAARQADVVVVALAEWPGTEIPGNIDDLTLPEGQLRLARAMEATGKPVVLTLFHDRPRVLDDAVDGARAVVTAYETGPFGGEALAAVLYGDVNPSGRLPFTWPRHTGAIEHYDRPEPSNASGGYAPQWPFGHGLSYTTFTYADLRLDRASAGVDDTVTVSVTVANTGPRAGQEVVQLYSRDLYASIAPATRRLRDFRKVALAPGERRTVTFRLPVRRLAFIGLDDRPVVEPGDFDLTIGELTRRLTIR
jgi:beta-glucosidase